MNELKLNDKLYGFKITDISEIADISATAIQMKFEQTGTKLLWLKRNDDNKTFAITFKTVPHDSTGVFHILEHSVLCGSAKYPLKEPFVDLLKSSMQTFLNAMTFPDKTMYPVSSRNDKDLLNLMDVYLDAVFNPLCQTKKEIFLQEGRHIEVDENGDWFYNGVVYNEMRGVYSSVDSRMSDELQHRLFPNHCYGVDSGGNPDVIPSLSYEQFVAAYKKFYHPSNATIFLDGAVNLNETLPLIESYLEKYQKQDCDISVEEAVPVNAGVAEVEYEVNEDDDAIGKTEIIEGYVFATFDQRQRQSAVALLSALLCSSNDSPLKKALLESGLAEDVYFYPLDDIRQPVLCLVMRGVPKGNEGEAHQAAMNVIENMITSGVPVDQLEALINRAEFNAREQDYGSEPAGLIYAIKAQETWLYGGDPKDALSFSEIFTSLRNELGSGYYENLLKEVFIDNNHTAMVRMIPSTTLAAENAEKLKNRMAEYKASCADEEKEQLKADGEKLEIFRSSVDSPELSALIPHLELSDIEPECKPNTAEEYEINLVKIIHSPKAPAGIVYTEMLFDINDFSAYELWAASMLTGVIDQCATEQRSALEFLTEVRRDLGRFSTSTVTSRKENMGVDESSAYFKFSIAAKAENKAQMVKLFAERLNETVIDTQTVSQVLKQTKLSYELSLKENGNRHALIQAKAPLSRLGAADEIISGETNYHFNLDAIENPEKLTETLKAVLEKLNSRSRLTMFLIGERDDDLAKGLIDCVNDTKSEIIPAKYDYLSKESSKIKIASDVSYAAKAVSLISENGNATAGLSVASQLLTLEYLWNEVRVKGGAYGCSCGFSSQNGFLAMASYRDPNPANSLNIFNAAAKALCSIAESSNDIAKYIIATIAAGEPLETLGREGKRDCMAVLNGNTDEKRNARRHEILSLSKDELVALAKFFEVFAADGVECVVGG